MLCCAVLSRLRTPTAAAPRPGSRQCCAVPSKSDKGNSKQDCSQQQLSHLKRWMRDCAYVRRWADRHTLLCTALTHALHMLKARAQKNLSNTPYTPLLAIHRHQACCEHKHASPNQDAQIGAKVLHGTHATIREAGTWRMAVGNRHTASAAHLVTAHCTYRAACGGLSPPWGAPRQNRRMQFQLDQAVHGWETGSQRRHVSSGFNA
jgi:hypothetical protein